MTLVAQLSDLHLGGPDPSAESRVRATIAAVAAIDPAPDCVLVTGDVTDTAGAAEALRAAELLRELAGPVVVIPGNHDDRGALRAAFGPDGDGPMCHATDCGDLRILACDTLVPGHPEGGLDAAQLAWLDAELGRATGTPALVAMHHPPIAIGVAAIDAVMLDADDAAALGDVLARHPQVLAVVCGHVHRTAAGALGAVPVRTCPSAWRQLAVDFTAGDELADIHLSGEPPGFALHRYADGALTTHIVPVDVPAA